MKPFTLTIDANKQAALLGMSSYEHKYLANWDYLEAQMRDRKLTIAPNDGVLVISRDDDFGDVSYAWCMRVPAEFGKPTTRVTFSRNQQAKLNDNWFLISVVIKLQLKQGGADLDVRWPFAPLTGTTVCHYDEDFSEYVFSWYAKSFN